MQVRFLIRCGSSALSCAHNCSTSPRIPGSAGLLLDELLLQYTFIDAVFQAGKGSRVIRDLVSSLHPLPPFATDVLRWLKWGQYGLSGKSGNALEQALLPPPHTLVYVAAAAGQRWRCERILPNELNTWAPLEMTMKVGGATSRGWGT
jgi:hypothetical protein